jgi:tetratricopeptide (TPR) repeat protein
VRNRAIFAFLAALLAGCASTPPAERAMSLARQHREAEAIAMLRIDLAKKPDDVAARRMLVRLLAYTGDLEAARAEVAELQRRLPEGDPTSWIELGHALELAHKFDEALAAYDEAASAAPASPDGPREGGMRAARWGEVEAARPRLEEAVKRGAHDPETWHTLGLVRLRAHDLDGAEQAYRAGLKEDPDAVDNLLGLATVAWVRGDAKAALAAYDAILARRPRAADASLGRAYALAKLGRKDEAAKELDHAEELGASRAHVDKQRAALRSGNDRTTE